MTMRITDCRPASRDAARQGRPPRPPRKQRSTRFTGLAHIALAVWALLVIAPAALGDPGVVQDQHRDLPRQPRSPCRRRSPSRATAGVERGARRAVLPQQRLRRGTLSTAGTMLFGSMAAYVLARYKFFGNRIIYYLFVSGLAFPVFLALVPLFLVAATTSGCTNTYTGLILVYIAYSLPFTVFFLAAFFKTLPNAIAEAAMIDGASHTRLFFQVMLPMAKPAWSASRSSTSSASGTSTCCRWRSCRAQNADQKWVLTQGIANISVVGRLPGGLGGAVRRADPLHPADDHRLRVLPAADPGRPHRRRGQVVPDRRRRRSPDRTVARLPASELRSFPGPRCRHPGGTMTGVLVAVVAEEPGGQRVAPLHPDGAACRPGPSAFADLPAALAAREAADASALGLGRHRHGVPAAAARRRAGAALPRRRADRGAAARPRRPLGRAARACRRPGPG